MQKLISIDTQSLQFFANNPESLLREDISVQISVATSPNAPSHLLEILANSESPEIAEAAQLHINYAGELNDQGREQAEEKLKSRYIGQNDRLAVELLKIAPVPPFFLSEWMPARHLIQALSNPYLPPHYLEELLERLAQEPSLEPRLEVAENPQTPSSVLELLAGDLELAIRLAVQHNPNCPQGLIRLLEGQHEIASNWDTEREQLANLAQSRWNWIRLAVAQNPSTLEETLLRLARDRVFQIRLAVANNPVTPATVLSVLAACDQAIQAVVAKHNNATEEILHRLFASQRGVIKSRSDLPPSIIERFFQEAQIEPPFWDRKNSSLRSFFFRQPNTPSWILEQFADVDVEAIRQEKAALREPPPEPELLEEWVTDDLDFLAEIANHPQVSVEILTRLSQYPNEKVKLAVAQNLQTPEELRLELLETLARRSDHRIKVQIAEDVNTPAFILERLAGERQKIISLSQRQKKLIAALLKNPSTPQSVRDRLGQQYSQPWERFNTYFPEPLFRIALASNPAIPQRERQEYLEQAFLSQRNDIKKAVAEHLDTPLAILEQIAEPGVGGLQKVVKNPNAPVHLLRQAVEQIENSSGLSHSLSDVAKNPNTPLPLLRQLALKKGNYGIREAVLANPNLDPINAYEIQLQIQAQEETRKANQIFANRPNSPYALTQVLKTGDQRAKLTAARSRSTPIAVLEQLAKDSDPTIRQAVSENPNLPLSALLELTQDNNFRVRLSLARDRRYQTTPVEILERLANDSSDMVRAEVAGNKNTPVEILTQLAHDESTSVCNRLTRNQNTPVEVLEFLGVERTIANPHNPKTPTDALAAVIQAILQSRARDRDKALDKMIKSRTSAIPSYILEQLATYSTSWIRSSVAHHRNTPASALEKMVNDYYSPVLWGIARNPNSTIETLEKLLNRPDLENKDIQQIYSALAERQDIPPRFMDQLLNSDSTRLRQKIASRPHLPSELATKLIANESEESVLIALARNPNLTSEQLTQLLEHPSPNVRTTLVGHRNLTKTHWWQLAQDEALSVREAVAIRGNSEIPNFPLEILEFLSRDEEVQVRCRVAGNVRTPENVLATLAQDENLNVRADVADNPNLPFAQLEQLSQDEKIKVRRAVLQNPNTPASIRDSLQEPTPVETNAQSPISPTLRGLSRIYNPDTDDLRTILSEYAELDVPFIRLVALLHPLTPVATLQEGAQSISWLERYAVADNPATPREIRQQLAQDSNQIVRAVAIAY